jgi:hypothetical protein
MAAPPTRRPAAIDDISSCQKPEAVRRANAESTLESFRHHTWADRTCNGTGARFDFLDWGKVNAELEDNDTTRALVQMLPLTIEMRDHLRQEKTGSLPSPLPAAARQLEFSTGTLGLWNSDHFVMYYRDGRVPHPGIIRLGRVTGDVSIFDRPGPVTVRIERTR